MSGEECPNKPDHKNRFTTNPFFEDFTEEEKMRLVAVSKKVSYRKGETIFEQDEPGTTMYFIDSGQVSLERMDLSGRELILAVLGQGDFFGEMAVMDDAGRSARARAVSDVVLSAVSREDFHQLLLEYPHLALKIISTLCKRLRETDRRMEEIAFGRVKARLETLLAGQTDDGKVIKLNMTHQELAAKIGACRETVTRAIKELREEGWKIEKNNNLK